MRLATLLPHNPAPVSAIASVWRLPYAPLTYRIETAAAMELLTVIVAALAFAGGAAAKAAIGEGVKDAYRAVKDFLARKYPQVDLTAVEKDPGSKGQQMVLVEKLTSSEAAADPEFSPLAKRLVDAVAAEIRKAGPQTGVQLREFEAASLRINDVIASGAGVIAKKTKIAGHAEITGIRAGVSEDQNPKKP
jgi:hypothetical protein